MPRTATNVAYDPAEIVDYLVVRSLLRPHGDVVLPRYLYLKVVKLVGWLRTLYLLAALFFLALYESSPLCTFGLGHFLVRLISFMSAHLAKITLKIIVEFYLEFYMKFLILISIKS